MPPRDIGQGARLEAKSELVLKHLGLGTELSFEIPARVHELAHAGRGVKPRAVRNAAA